MRDIQLAAEEPLRPLRAAADVHHLFVGLEPIDAHGAHELVPESFGLLAGKSQEGFAVVEAQLLHEAPNVGACNEFG